MKNFSPVRLYDSRQTQKLADVTFLLVFRQVIIDNPLSANCVHSWFCHYVHRLVEKTWGLVDRSLLLPVRWFVRQNFLLSEKDNELYDILRLIILQLVLALLHGKLFYFLKE